MCVRLYLVYDDAEEKTKKQLNGKTSEIDIIFDIFLVVSYNALGKIK